MTTNIYPDPFFPLRAAMPLEYSYKHNLRQKEVAKIASDLSAMLGSPSLAPTDTVESARVKDFKKPGEWDVLFVGGQIVAFTHNGRPMLTVRGLLKYGGRSRWVTVDMGAIPYVCNGADIMAPGIVAADPAIHPGDYVWIRDEKNSKPLAVCEALMSGAEMSAAEKGKAAKMLHHVGDDLWNCQ